jgi:hypothetical protein
MGVLFFNPVVFCNLFSQLMPLHEEEDTGEGGDSASIQSSRDGEDPEPTEAKLRMPKIKTDYRAYVNFCGLPFNGNKAAGKFDIDCEQYTQIAKGGPTTVFPVSCWIINSPRWSPDKKPVPFSNRFISASGFLVGVEKREVPGSPHTWCFIVDVDNVVPGYQCHRRTDYSRCVDIIFLNGC